MLSVETRALQHKNCLNDLLVEMYLQKDTIQVHEWEKKL